MPFVQVKIDAASTDRSVAEPAPLRPGLVANPVLKLWRWMINSAVADAKKTRNGLPTDGAIHARWWLEDHQPVESDREEWERSFAACCMWLDLNVGEERARVLREVDAAWKTALDAYVSGYMYQRRALVRSCAGGRAATFGRQMLMPLMHGLDFETVSGVEHDDPPGWEKKLRPLRAA